MIVFLPSCDSCTVNKLNADQILRVGSRRDVLICSEGPAEEFARSLGAHGTALNMIDQGSGVRLGNGPLPIGFAAIGVEHGRITSVTLSVHEFLAERVEL